MYIIIAQAMWIFGITGEMMELKFLSLTQIPFTHHQSARTAYPYPAFLVTSNKTHAVALPDRVSLPEVSCMYKLYIAFQGRLQVHTVQSAPKSGYPQLLPAVNMQTEDVIVA